MAKLALIHHCNDPFAMWIVGLSESFPLCLSCARIIVSLLDAANQCGGRVAWMQQVVLTNNDLFRITTRCDLEDGWFSF